jgi:hypothetical protein
MRRQVGNDRFEKNLRIGVRFDGTGFVLLDGRPLPRLKKDSAAELIVSAECLVDARVRDSFERQTSVLLLDQGSSVLLGVSPTMIEDIGAAGLILPSSLPLISEYVFVEVKLNAPLWLEIRGDQETRLSQCNCTVSVLKKSAQSLNHAFTLISEAYETKRRSHSGNVFRRGYARSNSAWWRSLDELRLEAIQKIESDKNSNARTDVPTT